MIAKMSKFMSKDQIEKPYSKMNKKEKRKRIHDLW
jgi:hypothetical protein